MLCSIYEVVTLDWGACFEHLKDLSSVCKILSIKFVDVKSYR
jgi:hypothetical protein